MAHDITMEQFQKVLPAKVRKTINPVIIDGINKAISDPAMRENYRDNLLGYVNVMMDGRFKIQSYIDAVRYVSYKLMGDSNIKAYTKAFPDRYQAHVVSGTSDKDIASYITAYNKNKLVNLIFEQTLVPSHVLNADMYQKALNVQAALMTDDKISPKVRSDAANSILTHLKRPETQQVELNIGIKEDQSIIDLRQATLELVKKQKESLSLGALNAQEVAHSNIVTAVIEGEFTEDVR